MGIAHLRGVFHVQMGLPGWIVHFLAQIGNVGKQASKSTLSQTSELYI